MFNRFSGRWHFSLFFLCLLLPRQKFSVWISKVLICGRPSYVTGAIRVREIISEKNWFGWNRTHFALNTERTHLDTNWIRNYLDKKSILRDFRFLAQTSVIICIFMKFYIMSLFISRDLQSDFLISIRNVAKLFDVLSDYAPWFWWEKCVITIP